MSYGPIWEKEVSIQNELLALDQATLREGSIAIMNHASHPGTLPTTQTLEELGYIDNQSVNKNRKSVVEGYALLMSLLDDKLTQRFINRFRCLFVCVLIPSDPYCFNTSELEENINLIGGNN